MMNGFQPISYGEVMPNININTDEIMQRLINIQTYSSLILNNIGITVDTGMILPEFVYNGSVSQSGYHLAYGIAHMTCGRNYDFELGLDMENLTAQSYMEITFKLNNNTYTVYPQYLPSHRYFYVASTYHCPVNVYAADKAIIATSYMASPGHCGFRFALNKDLRAPITILGVGQVKTAWAVPQY